MLRQAPRLLLGIALAAYSTAAEDPALTKVRTLLEPMRKINLNAAPALRGATPALTEIKHSLRDWIESRLHEFRNEDDARAFAAGLNDEIRAAKLACADVTTPRDQACPSIGETGYLGGIDIRWGETLTVITRVGIVCGFDESAYAYSLANGSWKRFWQHETNDYTVGKYVPLSFLGIRLSSPDYLNRSADPNVRLLLVLARDPAFCGSNWHKVYYRVWQLRLDRPEEKLLLDGGEEAFVGSWVDGDVSPRDVLIEYATKTTFTDFLVRSVVWHYVLRNGTLKRDDPLALSPRDFADEWMRTDWAISSQWTSPGADAAALQRMHDGKNFAAGDYTNTVYCEKQPEHWQVGLDWTDFNGQRMVATKRLYFLVRWLPPFRFSMSAISDHPWPGCTQPDPVADEQRTLFPIHLNQR